MGLRSARQDLHSKLRQVGYQTKNDGELEARIIEVGSSAQPTTVVVVVDDLKQCSHLHQVRR